MNERDRFQQWWQRTIPFTLGLTLVFSAMVRFNDLGHPGLWLDEILAVQARESQAACPYTGPLYDSVMAASAAIRPTEAGYRTPFAAAGVVSILLIYATGATVGGPATGLLSAILLASLPTHVYYSREARPYALLVMEALLGFLAVAQLTTSPLRSRMAHAMLYLAVGSLVLTSPHGVLSAVVLLTAHGVATFLLPANGSRARPLLLTLAASMLTMLVATALYSRLLGCGLGVDASRPALTWDALVRFVQAAQAGSSDTRVSSLSIALSFLGAGAASVVAGIGAVRLVRERGAVGIVLLLVPTFGLLLPLTILYVMDSWIPVRYLLVGISGLLVIIASGLTAMSYWIAGCVSRRRAALQPAIVLFVVVLIGIAIVQLQREPIRRALASRADWRHVARVLQEYVRPGDLVLTSSYWSHICLGYYLPLLDVRVELQTADKSVDRAHQLVAARAQAFLVTGGLRAEGDVREWMSQFRLIYESPQERIEIYRYPGN